MTYLTVTPITFFFIQQITDRIKSDSHEIKNLVNSSKFTCKLYFPKIGGSNVSVCLDRRQIYYQEITIKITTRW